MCCWGGGGKVEGLRGCVARACCEGGFGGLLGGLRGCVVVGGWVSFIERVCHTSMTADFLS